MGVLGYAVPVSLAILAFGYFYLSQKYRQARQIGRFEIYFNAANVFFLAAVYMIFGTLDFAANNAANGILGIFLGFLWIYVLITIFMVLKLIRNLIIDFMQFGGKTYIHGK